MRKDAFIGLIDRYLAGEATPEERFILEEYYMRLSSGKDLPVQQEDEENIKALLMKKILVQEISALPDRLAETPIAQIRIRRRIWIAAAGLLAIVSMAGYFLLNKHPPDAAVHAIPSLKNDIAPGGNKAVLTLANGSRVVLDTAKDGAITEQGNVRVLKLGDGQLAYNKENQRKSGDTASPTRISYNTLTTPRGGQYRIVLSDGTKVWLNAASTIRYPTAFMEGQRNVQITGEAYFEVEKDPTHPFTVSVNGAEVRALGTAFNIMAYTDETAMSTSLVEGAVRVSKGNTSKTLKPGQQVSLTSRDEMILVNDPAIEESIAWKNNLFSFNNADIQAVMRQLARWYDVDIVYAGKVSQHFNGNISRAVNVSKVFSMLELTGSVHFKIEGKRIEINP